MRITKYIAYTMVFLSVATILFLRSSAYADFQFAPPRAQAISADTTLDGNSQSELSTISGWENDVIAAIPPEWKAQLARWDMMRLGQAQKFDALRDSTGVTQVITTKTVGKKTTKVVTNQPIPYIHYWYVALAFFFGYSYVFYGTILLALLFLVRLVFLKLNIVA